MRAAKLLLLVALLTALLGAQGASQTPDMSKPPAVGPVKSYTPPAAHRDQLPNGLRIVVVEDHRFPLVTVQLALRAGSSRITPETAGLASAEADLLTKGTPTRNALPSSLDELGQQYIGAVATEVEKWLRGIEASSSSPEPIGVAFSGGIDSGAVFLVVYHAMLTMGLSPARLKAFVLNLGDGPDLDQARSFLSTLGLSIFLEEIEPASARLDVGETLQVLEDYKPLDVECAAMGLELCRAVQPVTRRRARGLDEPDALHVPQHARAPARGGSCLVDRQRGHLTPV